MWAINTTQKYIRVSMLHKTIKKIKMMRFSSLIGIGWKTNDVECDKNGEENYGSTKRPKKTIENNKTNINKNMIQLTCDV